MAHIELNKIFPHSFIDYLGRRACEVMIGGHHKGKELQKKFPFGTMVNVSDVRFDKENNRTTFFLNAYCGSYFLPLPTNPNSINP